MTRRVELLTEAADLLGWTAQVPHDLDRLIGIYAEATRESARPMRPGLTNDEILSRLSSRTDSGRGKGGHSDPTAMAALWGEGDADDGDETLGQIDHALDGLVRHTQELDDLVSLMMSRSVWRPVCRPGRSEKVRHIVTTIAHLSPDVDSLADSHPDWLVRQIHDDATWLHAKATGIWQATKGEYVPVRPEWKPITECANCTRYGITGTIAVAKVGDLCESCEDFRDKHKCQPNEAACREYDRKGMRANITTTMIAESKAASRAKVKPGRSKVS